MTLTRQRTRGDIQGGSHVKSGGDKSQSFSSTSFHQEATSMSQRQIFKRIAFNIIDPRLENAIYTMALTMQENCPKRKTLNVMIEEIEHPKKQRLRKRSRSALSNS